MILGIMHCVSPVEDYPDLSEIVLQTPRGPQDFPEWLFQVFLHTDACGYTGFVNVSITVDRFST